jgi:hypothetical protein
MKLRLNCMSNWAILKIRGSDAIGVKCANINEYASRLEDLAAASAEMYLTEERFLQFQLRRDT